MREVVPADNAGSAHDRIPFVRARQSSSCSLRGRAREVFSVGANERALPLPTAERAPRPFFAKMPV